MYSDKTMGNACVNVVKVFRAPNSAGDRLCVSIVSVSNANAFVAKLEKRYQRPVLMIVDSQPGSLRPYPIYRHLILLRSASDRPNLR